MMKFERHKVEAPSWLTEKWQKWGKLATNLKDNGKKVRWYNYKSKPVNQHLTPLLREITNNHCSFCDGFPMQQMVEQIEHFKPKSKFPELSHQWENLFLICAKCNETKGEEFNELLLKPDENDFSFGKYFKMNFDGLLEPEINLTEIEKKRVEITIKLYGLNKYGRPDARIDELNKNQNNQTGLYRFIYL